MKSTASFVIQLPFVDAEGCDFVLTTVLESQKIIEANRKIVCSSHSVIILLSAF